MLNPPELKAANGFTAYVVAYPEASTVVVGTVKVGIKVEVPAEADATVVASTVASADELSELELLELLELELEELELELELPVLAVPKRFAKILLASAVFSAMSSSSVWVTTVVATTT